jgi:ankyrin repeat protein
MLQAMYKTTLPGCEQRIQAIAKLLLEQNKNYVRRNFGEKHGECAMWSRQHSLVLAALNDLDESSGVISCGLEEKRLRELPTAFWRKLWASRDCEATCTEFGADVKADDNSEWTPLHLAAGSANEGCFSRAKQTNLDLSLWTKSLVQVEN